MKIKVILYCLAFSLCCAGDNFAYASDTSLARTCLDYGKSVMKQNPDVLNRLRQANVVVEDIQVNDFSSKIGSQYISTELIATLYGRQEKQGRILCLMNSDEKPLYFNFMPHE